MCEMEWKIEGVETGQPERGPLSSSRLKKGGKRGSEWKRWHRVEQGSGATVEIKGTGSEWIGRQRWSKISPLGEWEDMVPCRDMGRT